MSEKNPPTYSPLEEKINVLTHGFGFVLSIVALVLLFMRANSLGTTKDVLSFSVFGACLIILYAASTFYHSAKKPLLRHWLNVVDHASIYVLIAGTYTPFALITLSESNGSLIFAIIWSLALIGIILKFFFIGKFMALSTIMYVAMGWLVVVDVRPLINTLPFWGSFWLFAGGFFYTLGAVIFSFDRIKFNHAIFHIFVLGGSFCHFISIFYFVLPEK